MDTLKALLRKKKAINYRTESILELKERIYSRMTSPSPQSLSFLPFFRNTSDMSSQFLNGIIKIQELDEKLEEYNQKQKDIDAAIVEYLDTLNLSHEVKQKITKKYFVNA